jgi:hypothetical protein
MDICRIIISNVKPTFVITCLLVDAVAIFARIRREGGSQLCSGHNNNQRDDAPQSVQG